MAHAAEKMASMMATMPMMMPPMTVAAISAETMVKRVVAIVSASALLKSGLNAVTLLLTMPYMKKPQVAVTAITAPMAPVT